MRLPCSVLLALAACASDQDPQCRSSYLTYETFGAPFMTSWCTGCHGADLPPGMRQRAPGSVNFDTLDEIRAQELAIEATTVDAITMPPAGGPSDSDRALLGQWLQCGAP